MLELLPPLIQGSNGGAGNAEIPPTVDPGTQRSSWKCGNRSLPWTQPLPKTDTWWEPLRRLLPTSLSRLPWNSRAYPVPTLTTRMYPSGGTRLISFFSCSTARTRSMTFPYTGSSVRSRLAVGAGWMDCQETGIRRDQMDPGEKRETATSVHRGRGVPIPGSGQGKVGPGLEQSGIGEFPAHGMGWG